MSIDTDANQVIDKSMDIDEPADPSIATSQLNQEGNLRDQQSTLSLSEPIGTHIPTNITQSESKSKQKGQVT